MKIVVEGKANAPLDRVWCAWTTPESITQWNAATDEWHTPRAAIDLREGGDFCYRMEARDGSMGFDYSGVFKRVEPQKAIEFDLADSRSVLVEFIPQDEGVLVRETFEPDLDHPREMQSAGWQAILDNFIRHVEALP